MKEKKKLGPRIALRRMRAKESQAKIPQKHVYDFFEKVMAPVQRADWLEFLGCVKHKYTQVWLRPHISTGGP